MLLWEAPWIQCSRSAKCEQQFSAHISPSDKCQASLPLIIGGETPYSPAAPSASAANSTLLGNHKTNREKGNQLRPRKKEIGSSEISDFKMKNCSEMFFSFSPITELNTPKWDFSKGKAGGGKLGKEYVCVSGGRSWMRLGTYHLCTQQRAWHPVSAQ